MKIIISKWVQIWIIGIIVYLLSISAYIQFSDHYYFLHQSSTYHSNLVLKIILSSPAFVLGQSSVALSWILFHGINVFSWFLICYLGYAISQYKSIIRRIGQLPSWIKVWIAGVIIYMIAIAIFLQSSQHWVLFSSKWPFACTVGMYILALSPVSFLAIHLARGSDVLFWILFHGINIFLWFLICYFCNFSYKEYARKNYK